MPYKILADITLIVHFIFILFVLLGGLLVLRNRKWAFVHIPAAIWAAVIEFMGWICPLTPLENRFREIGGLETYETGFIEHYLLPLIYPSGLTRGIQIILGLIVIAVNLAIYLWVYRRSE